QITELQARLTESDATIQAIRDGEVDAVVVYHPTGQRVYSITGADQPYRLLIEAMQQGAATLTLDGTILYCNGSFAAMVQRPQEQLIGASVQDLVVPEDRAKLEKILAQATGLASEQELTLAHDEGSQLCVSASTGELR